MPEGEVMGGRGQGVHGRHRTSNAHRQDAIERYRSIRVHYDFLRLQAVQWQWQH